MAQNARQEQDEIGHGGVTCRGESATLSADVDGRNGVALRKEWGGEKVDPRCVDRGVSMKREDDHDAKLDEVREDRALTRLLANPVAGVDPGPVQSAIAYYNGKAIRALTVDNVVLIESFRIEQVPQHICIEKMQSFGMPVGAEVFETCIWIGRYFEVLKSKGVEVTLMARPTIKAHIVGTVRSKDKDVRAALIQRLGVEVTKDITGHQWAALAVAVCLYDELRSRH